MGKLPLNSDIRDRPCVPADAGHRGHTRKTQPGQHTRRLAQGHGPHWAAGTRPSGSATRSSAYSWAGTTGRNRHAHPWWGWNCSLKQQRDHGFTHQAGWGDPWRHRVSEGRWRPLTSGEWGTVSWAFKTLHTLFNSGVESAERVSDYRPPYVRAELKARSYRCYNICKLRWYRKGVDFMRWNGVGPQIS